MSIQDFGVTDEPLTPRRRWSCFATIFFLAFLAAFNMFKASPAIQYIAADLSMPQAMVSQIMGTYALAALAMAFPGMWLMQKMGFKFSTLVAGASMIAGSLICGLTTSATVFLIGRVIEGIGYGLLAVIGPASVPRLLPSDRVGFAMGIWSQWLPVGTIGAFFIAPIAFDAAGGQQVAFSWHAIWYLALALEAIGIVLALISIKMPAVAANAGAAGQGRGAKDMDEAGHGRGEVQGRRPLRDYLASAMVLSIAFVAWTYLYVGNTNTFYPTFLQNFKGLSVSDSSMILTITAIIAAVTGVGIGAFAAKRDCRKALIVTGYLCLAVLFFYLFYTPGEDMVGPWVAVVAMGVITGAVPTCTYSLVPVLVRNPKKTDLALTTLTFFMALGKVLGGFIVSPTLVAIGYYANARYVCAPLAIAAALLVLVFVRSDRRIAKDTRRESEIGPGPAPGSRDRPVFPLTGSKAPIPIDLIKAPYSTSAKPYPISPSVR